MQNKQWIDRETGVAGVMVVNCIPWGDAISGQLWDELERAVYLLPVFREIN